jgi:hypothetical protein
VDIYWSAARHDIDDGKGSRGSGTHIEINRDDRILRERNGGGSDEGNYAGRDRDAVTSHEIFLST